MTQVERRAAPKPACVPPGDRTTYSSGEGQSQVERRAAPKPACVPPGDRTMYSSGQGQS